MNLRTWYYSYISYHGSFQWLLSKHNKYIKHLFSTVFSTEKVYNKLYNYDPEFLMWDAYTLPIHFIRFLHIFSKFNLISNILVRVQRLNVNSYIKEVQSIYKITDYSFWNFMKRRLNKKTIFYLKMTENEKYLSVYWNIRLLYCMSSTLISTSFI